MSDEAMEIRLVVEKSLLTHNQEEIDRLHLDRDAERVRINTSVKPRGGYSGGIPAALKRARNSLVLSSASRMGVSRSRKRIDIFVW